MLSLPAYAIWALVALTAYTAFPALMRLATREIPMSVAAIGANSIFLVASIALAAYQGQRVATFMDHPDVKYVILAGVSLAFGILAYYQALSLGPVSIVTPIFGLFIVTSAAVGIVFLGESLTIRKVAGVGFGILAIYLLTVR